ncbi:putative membrane protein [Aequitasia blattaphilus]|uniref:DUF2142 domain-containing protein n=1 Tax=Aequitasia blattaphilus TaxID=2949332 RepID=A0ABT1E641_9FIRM|nr:DUF2142 domain-containing protein [Aequitasia blattaphilus]MCP1101305.1 DUF2142 domain-containing protein [Aequitasia blattaphilus]MCR8613945.1 DUF2142 domain-containing protein [Aequitasia blattaphilus]
MSKKKAIIIGSFLVLIIGFLAVFYKREVLSVMTEPNVIYKEIRGMNIETNTKVGLREKESVTQKIHMISNEISGLNFTYERDDIAQGLIYLTLKDQDGQEIKQWEIIVETMPEKETYNVFFEEPLKVHPGDVYTMEFTSKKLEGDVRLITGRDELTDRFIHVDGKEIDEKVLGYGIINGNCMSIKWIFGLFVFGGFLSLALTIILIWKKKEVEKIFVTSILVLGCIVILIIPPFISPDEGVHFITAYTQSSKLLGRPVTGDQGRALVDGDAYIYRVSPTLKSRSSYVRFFKGAIGREVSVSPKEDILRSPLSVPGFAYAPQVIGISIGRLLHVNGEQLMYIGRLFALLCYGFIMYWAIKLLPYGKNIYYLIGILPMTLQMTTSFNYDSVLLGSCFFLIAYLLYLKESKKKIGIKDYILVLLPIIAIAGIKPVYLPILAIAFLIPKERFGNGIIKTIAACVMGGCAILTTLITRMTNISGLVNPEIEGVPRYTIASVLGNPVSSLTYMMNTLIDKLSYYIETMVGGPYGWLEIETPSLLLAFTILLFGLAVIQRDGKVRHIYAKERWCYGLISVGTLFLLLFVMMIDHTTVLSPYIEGVQGRYLLPVLPLVLLMVSNKSVVLRKNIDAYIYVGANMVTLTTMFYIFREIIHSP